ncbi:hypothetical protein BH10ACT11_BH10ACT11_18730 [soil metagenome]
MSGKQLWRLRAPASGREAIAPIDDESDVFIDSETGEEMQLVSRVLPLADSDSTLLRAPENLRECPRCDQLIGVDLANCPYCGLRQPPLG